MLSLPARLEERLKKFFSRARDREQFVKETIENALEALETGATGEGLPESVGGVLHLFTDGGSRGNPGDAAIGCVLIDPMTGKVLKEYKEAIGHQTNNIAEYRALLAGLELARAFQPNRLICHLDSELVVKQLSGEYRVKMASLQPLVEEIQNVAGTFRDVSFVHIPREENHRADRLVNSALDALSIRK